MMETEKLELIKLIINDEDPRKLSNSVKQLLLSYAELIKTDELSQVKISDDKLKESIIPQLLLGKELELDDATIEKVIDYIEKNFDDFYVRVNNNHISLDSQIKCKKTDCTKPECVKQEPKVCKCGEASCEKHNEHELEYSDILDVLRSVFSSIK